MSNFLSESLFNYFHMKGSTLYKRKSLLLLISLLRKKKERKKKQAKIQNKQFNPPPKKNNQKTRQTRIHSCVSYIFELLLIEYRAMNTL